MNIIQKNPDRQGFAKWFGKAIETTIKASILLSYPLLPAIGVCTFWYYALFRRGIHFHEGFKEIAVTAWISTFGILYAILAGAILTSVWKEYKGMRMAIKNYDIVTFMNLRDEDVSPLIHVMMAVFSWAVLLGFVGLKYPDATSGLICIGTAAYLFGLVFFVIMEIDNPLAGVWFIKSTHKEWIAMDVKEWRKAYIAEIKQKQAVKPVLEMKAAA